MTGAWWIDWCPVTGAWCNHWMTGDWMTGDRLSSAWLTSEKLPGAWLTSDWLTGAWLTGDWLTSDWLTDDWWTYFGCIQHPSRSHLDGSYPWQYSPVGWCSHQLYCHQINLKWQPVFSSCSVSSLSSLTFLQLTYDVCLQVSKFLQTKYYA